MTHSPAIFSFCRFVFERERIRMDKESGRPRPWTDDRILAEWRFCNVNRNDDTVTKWIMGNYVKHETDPVTLVMKLAVARFINWPDTLDHIQRYGAFSTYGGWEPEKFKKVMEVKGGKLYTGAYMIRAGTGEDAKMPKHDYLIKRVFNPLYRRLLEKGISDGSWEGATCADWDIFLGYIFGMGDFMRNQVITDMKYTFMLPKKTKDWKTFCLAGPGTNRGLNRVYGLPLKSIRSKAEGTAALNLFRVSVAECMSDLYPAGPVKAMNLIFRDLNNLSNCLCEFDKYERVRRGEGTPRSRYTPAPV